MEFDEEETKLIIDMAVEIRELLLDHAEEPYGSAMIGSPIECIGYGVKWIKENLQLVLNERARYES